MSLPDLSRFYINGAWLAPVSSARLPLIDPATEEEFGMLAMGGAEDVERAVQAAHAALPAFSETTPEERTALLRRILALYEERLEEFAEAMRQEMGAPIGFSRKAQAARGSLHLNALIEVMERFSFEENGRSGTTRLRYEPVGVCGLITPWNWPINQIVVKVAPAIAAGCTMVLKPSEFSAVSAILFAQVLHEAGVPPGVFNLVNGDGRNVGSVISSHPLIDMVSFTGSTGAGIEVAKSAAPTVKRVTQELGGKSANILLDDVDFTEAVKKGVAACFTNSGQSCSIPTRMIVPRERMQEVVELAVAAAAKFRLGDTKDLQTDLGPLVNRAQFERVRGLIQSGIDEGATLQTGGPERPEGLEKGYYVRPTIFTEVTPEMTIAREEIFGPVLSILAYDSEEEAIEIANSSNYGLAAYVQSGSLDRARRVARKLRGGQVHINYPPADFHAPFGGFRQSGNGREWGEAGLREYLEVKAIIGYQSEPSS
ncbi:aldehyde dehydrogenase family protein [Halomonas daqingensis]|uniref:Aldehyde dehydrogenase family protein n=1 Tax=Billgrantia desiderata TaxID=52021 RepID=A0ABS9BAN0_9GAMM|nr:aldehyde dehydrogenase family protein [Halomonas desiderata]MCE8044394.1 aldehyde dehydrogenase family protein [Halomonas desiderata]MCE8048968.1 aldehyde dehydrogenase family protein [Halomonas desiderata]